MKKQNFSISVDAEMLRATKKYMEKKDLSLEAELLDSLQKLYEKHVPAAVREYLAERSDEVLKRPPPPPKQNPTVSEQPHDPQ